MENIIQPGRLLSKVISMILAEDEFKLPSESKEFKELRNVVKTNGAAVSEVVTGLFTRFEKWDSDMRHAALLVCDYFFHRSHQFRLEIIEKLPELLELVVESNPLRMPLPPPAAAAKSLKTAAIKLVRVWHEKFKVGYTNLDFVDQFLAHSKSIDYEQATAAVAAERQAKEKKEKKIAQENARRCEKALTKIRNAKEDIERNLIEVENGLHILVPTFEEEFLPETPSNSQETNDQLNGISDKLTIILKSSRPEVMITEDNEPIVDVVKDGHVLLTGYLKLVMNALAVLQKHGASQEQIIEAVDIRSKLSGIIKKIEELKLSRKRTKRDSSDSEESDLEEVPEKQLEDFVAPYEVPKYIMDKIAEESKNNKPCCSKTIHTEEETEKPSSSKVPILSYGLDLKYWGEERGVVQIPRNNFDGHRFWRPPDEEENTIGKVDSGHYETRTITYVGEEIRPKRECRARLSNGQLCPRRDKNKCPVHGAIVDRDDEGFPLSEITVEQPSLQASKNQEDDEEEFIKDVEMATGQDLSGKIKKKKNRRHEPHQGKIIRDRLEKKLLDKRTVKRIGDTLDAIQKARIEKKHGHQFVHALHR